MDNEFLFAIKELIVRVNVANVIMNFVGNHGVNRPCHVANYRQFGNVMGVSRDK